LVLYLKLSFHTPVAEQTGAGSGGAVSPHLRRAFMRIVEIIWNEDEEKFDEMDDERIAVACWNETVDAVLEDIDEQLEAFGLEIIQYDIGEASDYMWRIDKRLPEQGEQAAEVVSLYARSVRRNELDRDAESD